MGLRQRLHFWLPRTSPGGWPRDWLTYFVASSLVVGLGVAFAQRFIAPSVPGDRRSFIDCLVRWDGAYYLTIARDGYRYTPGRQSAVHFWPLYPLLARSVAALTGLSTKYALVLVSHLCFAAALFWLGQYIDLRVGPGVTGVRSTALLALACVAAGVFFHMAYTESLFFLLCVLELYLIERGAHPLAVTALAGLAIVTRPPGVALLAPLSVYLFRRGDDRGRAAGWLCICLPLALSGLVAFLLYCQAAFDDPLAPIRDRTFLWRMRELPTLPQKILALLTLQPCWEIFQPTSPAYWSKWIPDRPLLFALYPANPFYFMAAFLLLGLGVVRRWLNYAEILLTACLLLIPYWTNGYETCMVSMARYAFVAPPLYLVLGRLLACFSLGTIAVVAALSSFFLAAYAGLFAQGYWII